MRKATENMTREARRAYYATRKPFLPEIGATYENEGGFSVVVLDSIRHGVVDGRAHAVVKNTRSGWVCTAHGVGIYEDGAIDWDGSTDGYFDDEEAREVVKWREYKGQPQTELTRVKVLDRIYDASVEMAQKREAKKADQLASLRGEDFVWEMPYRQYKERYADCETVVDSFDDHDGRFPATIKVIIREGRLKASGVRGGHYSGYEFTFCEGGEKHRVCYRAISEETAMKRLLKEFPNAEDITPGQIYDYMAASDFLRDHFW